MAEQQQTRPISAGPARDRLDTLKLLVQDLDGIEWTFSACDLIELAEYVRTGVRKP
jgi:hypothetical protein